MRAEIFVSESLRELGKGGASWFLTVVRPLLLGNRGRRPRLKAGAFSSLQLGMPRRAQIRSASSPLETVRLEGLPDDIETASVCAILCGLQTRLCEIEWVTDEDCANTTETAGEEGFDCAGGLLLLLELLVGDGS